MVAEAPVAGARAGRGPPLRPEAEPAEPRGVADRARGRSGEPEQEVTAPPFVGLTGGIGAGKSEALAALERLGAATITADRIVHELYDDPEVRAAVVGALGRRGRPRGPRGPLRGRAPRLRHRRGPATGSRACSGPASAERVGEWRAAEAARDPAPRALVVETPLLFEAGLEGNYDATIAVVADEAVRAERARARGHEALDERTARQLTQAEKAERATYAVENSGSLRDLGAGAVGILAKLKT